MTQRILLIVVIVLCVVSIGYALMHVSIPTQKPVATGDFHTLPAQPPTRLATPEGMTRDPSNAVPTAFPQGLVDPKDIKVATESFSFKGAKSNVTQYTFKYVANKNATQERDYFIDYFNKNRISLIGVTGMNGQIIITGKVNNVYVLTILISAANHKSIEIEINYLK